jgi:hypothetical protein
MEVGWYLRVLAEQLPIGGTFVYEDIGFAGYTLRDARLLDARGLTWPAAARFSALQLGPDVVMASIPEARAFVASFLEADPALVLLTCPVEGYRSPPERALLPDEWFQQRWHLAARGPYLGGNGRVCLYERDDFEPAGPEVGITRYERMQRELPAVQDWGALLDAVRSGRAGDAAGPWRVSPDGTPTPTAAPDTAAPAGPGSGPAEEERQRRMEERRRRREERRASPSP